MRLHAIALRPRTLLLLGVALFAVADVTLTAFARPAGSAPAAGAKVQLRSTGLGRVLVDSRGHTLYLFEADKGTKSACYGKCATAWPPLYTTGTPVAGTGIKASLLKTTKRHDGRLQVTYGGHPLYLFFKDTKAGQTSGENLDFFGGEWYALSAAGKKVEPKGGGGTTTTTSTSTTPTPTTTSGGAGGGGGGYGSGYSG